MTQGALIFAFNNDTIDYVSMAKWAANRIHRHLNIPVSLVTDKPLNEPLFDHIITVDPGTPGTRWFDDYGQTVPWYNTTRADAYDLSPYDLTLVLDCDYVVCGQDLLSLMDTCYSFLAPRYAYDVTNLTDMRDLNWFGAHNMPGAWATVMMFRRCPDTEAAFGIIKMARDNWQHYRQLHNIQQPNYRNDYALAMSLNLVMGRTGMWPSIPWPMASVDPRHGIQQLGYDEFRIDYRTVDAKSRYVTLKNQDFHAMGKNQLGEIIASSS